MKKRRLSRRFSPADKDALQASAAEISQCLKLLTQNKINEKNCFDLPLSSLLRESKQDGEFERASVLLETGAAIYGKRVDNALQATHEVRERLFRSEQDKKTRKVVQTDTENKTASKKALVTNTLEVKADRLCVQEVTQVFQVDPLFRKMSRTFDKGGAQGMLLNNLTVSNGCRVKLDSSGSCHADEQSDSAFARDADAQAMFDSIAALVPDNVSSLPACPMLAKLEALLVDAETSANAPAVEKSGSACAVVKEQEEEDDDDDDGGFGDDFSDFLPDSPGPDPDTEHTSLSSNDVQPDSTDLGRRSSTSVLAPATAPFDLETAIRAGSVNDFVFFDPDMASRLPQTRRARQRTVAQKTTRAKSASSKEKFAFDFSSTSTLSVAERAQLFKKPKKQVQTQLSQKSLKTASTLHDMAPPAPPFAASTLSRMFLNQRLSILCRAMVSSPEHEAEASGEDEDWDDGGNDFDDEDGCVVQDNRTMAFGESEDDFLIAAEAQVNKMDIHYETVHKRVDVKSLKTNLWKSVSDKIIKEEDEPSPAKSADVTFTEAVSSMAADMPSAASVPVLFICVLHLANEKGLRLSNGCSEGDLSCMKDFLIEPIDTDDVLDR